MFGFCLKIVFLLVISSFWEEGYLFLHISQIPRYVLLLHKQFNMYFPTRGTQLKGIRSWQKFSLEKTKEKKQPPSPLSSLSLTKPPIALQVEWQNNEVFLCRFNKQLKLHIVFPCHYEAPERKVSRFPYMSLFLYDRKLLNLEPIHRYTRIGNVYLKNNLANFWL